jgi:hypothetical protein
LKIAYLDLSSISDPNTGYKKKIAKQAAALRSLDVEVTVLDIALSESGNESGKYSGSGIIKTIKRRKMLLDKCEELIISHKIDAIYARYPGGDAVFAKFASKYGCLIITEHQSLELQEMRINKMWLRYISESIYGASILRNVAGLVGVTKEICDYEVKRSRDLNKHCFTNGNGIEVSSVPIRKTPAFDGKNLELLSVAQVAKWHGLDRLIYGIAENKNHISVRLHIVGHGSEISALKKLVSDLALERSVLFYGFKTGEELDAFFDKCHIAVGSLGLHRIGVSEGSILKVREYCARGIPFIYGAMDSDFCEDFPYLVRVAPDESPIDLNVVFSFADRALSDTEHSVKMREYAKENLDWSIKMKKLNDFMNEISGSKVRR